RCSFVAFPGWRRRRTQEATALQRDHPRTTVVHRHRTKPGPSDITAVCLGQINVLLQINVVGSGMIVNWITSFARPDASRLSERLGIGLLEGPSLLCPCGTPSRRCSGKS